MKKLLTILFLTTTICTIVPAKDTSEKRKDREPETSSVKNINYEYNILVYESAADNALVCKREVGGSDRGIFSALLDVYRSTLSGKIVNFSAELLSAGVNMIVKAIDQKKENYRQWQQTTQKELHFVKQMPMQAQITDFYQLPSTVGALDPDGIIFRGFGCTQYAVYREDHSIVRVPVMKIICSLDTTPAGMNRMSHHSKFQMQVDSIIFNPYLCNLPNDSLSAKQVSDGLRIPFDFKRRKDMKVRLQADITSSWINEAIQIADDQHLGSFTIEFNIPDSTVLDTAGTYSGYYTWFRDRDQYNPIKQVRLTGESFIVPRSFVSSTEQEGDVVSMWGTGQYKVAMTLEESCKINDDYYFSLHQKKNGKPERVSNKKWEEEYRIMKKRKPYPTFWNVIVEDFARTFDLQNHRWIHTLIDPVQNAVIMEEAKWLNTAMKVKPTNNQPSQNTNYQSTNNQSNNNANETKPNNNEGQDKRPNQK